MSNWDPVYRIYIDAVEFTTDVIANFSITSGRTDINTQPQAGYCSFNLVNLNNSSYSFDINSTVAIEVKDSSNNWRSLFGGFISDFTVQVQSAGSTAIVTGASITALGELAKLNRITDTTSLGEDTEGDQIRTLLEANLPQRWVDVPPALQWQNWNGGLTWAEAFSGIGDIDTGRFLMITKSTDPTNLYSYVTQLATSGGGILYEDANGNIAYDDYLHRQEYLNTNGYIEVSANDALFSGISAKKRVGDIRNKLTINYGNNANNTYTYSDTTSRDEYGEYDQTTTLLLKQSADAESYAVRYINTRKDPFSRFEQITFQLANPEISSADRNALIGIFNGMPIKITDLPANINGGEFQGFVEGWSFRAGVNSLALTVFLSPVEFWAPMYSLYQTYTANGTFTVPTGVSEIAVYAVGGGGNGAAGATSTSGSSGAGGGGGSGGSAGIFWHYPVTPGTNYSIVVGAAVQDTTFGGTLLVAGKGGSASGKFAGGSTASTSTAPNNQVLGAGSVGGGTGEDGVFNSNGIDAVGIVNNYPLTFPPGFGLPTGLKGGNGGAGGASGGHSVQAGVSRTGGLGTPVGLGVGALGGAGGNALANILDNDGFPGANGSGYGYGAGGAGGGGGGYHITTGTGFGGAGGAGNSGVVIVYVR